MAYATICNGDIIYLDGDFQTIDEAEMIAESKVAARKLWQRFKAL